MSLRVSRKRKEAWREKAKMMREAKAQKSEETSEETVENVEEAHSSVSADDSIVLPAPTASLDYTSGEESSSEDEDYEEEILEEEVSAKYQDWMSELDREDLQMMAMVMYDHFRSSLKFMKTRAAKEVAQCLGITDRTVRSWRKIFLSNSGSFEERIGNLMYLMMKNIGTWL